MRQNDWILDVLVDLRSAATENGLGALADHLHETLVVGRLRWHLWKTIPVRKRMANRLNLDRTLKILEATSTLEGIQDVIVKGARSL